MLTEKEIDAAIAELEAKEPTMAICTKLATLYTVRQNMHQDTRNTAPISWPQLPIKLQQDTPQAAPAMATDHTPYGDSPFLIAVARVNPETAWEIVDDLMDTLRVCNPRVYDHIMRRLDAAQ